jgi:hypothetical protein
MDTGTGNNKKGNLLAETYEFSNRFHKIFLSLNTGTEHQYRCKMFYQHCIYKIPVVSRYQLAVLVTIRKINRQNIGNNQSLTDTATNQYRCQLCYFEQNKILRPER